MLIIGDGTGIWSWVHLDDAVSATVVALGCGKRGVHNVVDDEPATVSEWLQYLAQVVGAKAPTRVPGWLVRLAVGEVCVRLMTEARGSSNAKSKREFDRRSAWSSWREDFRFGLGEAWVAA